MPYMSNINEHTKVHNLPNGFWMSENYLFHVSQNWFQFLQSMNKRFEIDVQVLHLWLLFIFSCQQIDKDIHLYTAPNNM